MKERSEKLIGQKEKDDAVINIESQKAQEAILNPNLSEERKDEILETAVTRILRIAERRNAYSARESESRQLKQSYTIYKAK